MLRQTRRSHTWIRVPPPQTTIVRTSLPPSDNVLLPALSRFGTIITTGTTTTPATIRIIPLRHHKCFSTNTMTTTITTSAGRSRKRRGPSHRVQVLEAEGLELRRNDVPAAAPSEGGKRDDSQTDWNSNATNITTTTTNTLGSGGRDDDNVDDESLPYPKGKPWRVLWPRPHGETTTSAGQASTTPSRPQIPRWNDFQRAWKKYMETWEDGLRGIPSPSSSPELTTKTTKGTGNADNVDVESSSIITSMSARQHLEVVGDNASRNVRLIRQDAQTLLEHAKEHTWIRTQNDVKAVASDMMRLATLCIREFMVGYRTGRDDEIDKMLNEYFKDTGVNAAGSTEPGDNLGGGSAPPTVTERAARRKRKPKRGIVRE